MAEKSKVIGLNSKDEQRIHNEWREFSKTLAYKKMMEYADDQSKMLLKYAEEMAMPSPNGGTVPLDIQKSHSLLQNKRGIGIMTTYIRLYSE